MTTAGGIDYKATNFENPEVPKIYGAPKLGPLINLHTKIKANAMSVPTILGGGAHGHLVITVFPEEYAEVSQTLYNRPNTPPEFDISGTQYEIAQKRHEYDEKIRLFREIQGVERTLIQQIVSAIEPKFLQDLCSSNTGKITRTIAFILRRID